MSQNISPTGPLARIKSKTATPVRNKKILTTAPIPLEIRLKLSFSSSREKLNPVVGEVSMRRFQGENNDWGNWGREK